MTGLHRDVTPKLAGRRGFVKATMLAQKIRGDLGRQAATVTSKGRLRNCINIACIISTLVPSRPHVTSPVTSIVVFRRILRPLGRLACGCCFAV